METSLKNFKRHFEKHEIELFNPFLKKVFDKFTFYLDLNEEFDINKFLPFKYESRIIVIDEYKEKQDEYLIFCFDFNLLIIKLNNQNNRFLTDFLLSNEWSEKYFFKRIPFLDKHSEVTDIIFLHEIYSFSSQFFINNSSFIVFWKAIINCFSGFVIKYSYEQSRKNINQISMGDFIEYHEKIEPRNKSFIKLRELGKGSCATVDLIYHLPSEKLFALKIPHDNCIDLIERERNNYLIIQNPYLAKYSGYLEDENKKCLLLDFIEGRTLKKYDTKKLNENEKYNIIFEIMISIHYIHSKQFIYRDLYPNNIIITQEKDAILIDFDRIITEKDQTTIDFNHEILPPEFDSIHHFSSKSDVYLLGILMYDILFNDFSCKNYEKKIINLSKSELTSGKKKVIESCLKENSNLRPNMSDLIQIFYKNFLKENISKKCIEENLVNLYANNLLNSNDHQGLYTIGIIYYDGIFVGFDFDKAFHYFCLAAKHNNSNAQFNLGVIYLKGKYVERDINKAIHYFTLAANQNYYLAQYNLAVIYDDGQYVERDISKAIHYFTLAANQNYYLAQYNLAIIYDEGQYVKRDINKAIHYYSCAASQSDPQSLYNLGHIHYCGINGSPDMNKAIHYFTLASEQNNPQAQYVLGTIFLFGLNGKVDIDKAIKYFKLAANQNISEALYVLGIIYIQGQYVKTDIKKAIHYFTLASNQNHSYAQYNLGVLYENGIYVPRDINKAIFYHSLAANHNLCQSQLHLGYLYQTLNNFQKSIYFYSLASNQKEPKASFNLAEIYFKGLGVEQNLEKSIYYLSLAADQNFPIAQNKIGFLYYKGIHVKRDIEKSIHYFTLSAKQNDKLGQCLLGIIYSEGQGIPRDIYKAIHYLTLSSNQNYYVAQFQLGITYYKETSITDHIQKSIYYLKLSADHNYSYAQFYLGFIYYEGIHISQDIKKAIHYFTISAEQNNPNSQYFLGMIYLKGLHVNQNVKKALYFFTSSLKIYDTSLFSFRSDALYQLGFLYYNQIHIQRDIKKAIKYLSEAADLYNDNAQYYLGYIYFEQSQIDKAIHYFKEASCFNNELAKNNLGVLFKLGKGVKQNIGQSIEYFNEAIRQENDPVAMFNLAHIYYFEEAGIIDIDKAFDLLIKSSQKQISYSNILLCLVAIKKFKSTDIKRIKKELEKIVQQQCSLLLEKIDYFIKSYRLYSPLNLSKINEQLSKINLFYYGTKVKNYRDVIKKENHIRIDINSRFYEGLGNI